MELVDLRNQIDMIDDELVRLFTKRMEISAQVADYKKEHKLPIYVPTREREILQEVAEKSGTEFADYSRVLYSMIFELSRSYQNKRNTSGTQLHQSVTDSIQNNNYPTRCICINKNLEICPGSDKTGIMMILPHKPGTLYKVLARLYMLGINVLKLESKPIPDNNFEFMLNFDLEISICSEKFVQLIGELDNICEEFII